MLVEVETIAEQFERHVRMCGEIEKEFFQGTLSTEKVKILVK